MLSCNPNALHILLKNKDKIDWESFSSNPAAIPYLLEHPEKIDWHWICTNPAAGELFNPEKILSWNWLSSNPAIFEYDYQAMSQSRPFTEELMQNRFHPRNMEKFDSWGHDE
jgi:hypothetical protein